MKRKRFSEEQIIAILREHEAGVATADLCRKHGMSSASFYAWKAKYGGMDVAVAHFETAHEKSERRARRVIGVDRTSVRCQRTTPDDAGQRARIKALAHERRRFGYRRLAILLRREGRLVNRKRVQRIYQEERLMVRRHGGRKRALGLRAPMAAHIARHPTPGTQPHWQRAVEGVGVEPHLAMNGQSEFSITGNILDFEREDDLEQLTMPVLYMSGEYDTCTPEASRAYAAKTPEGDVAVVAGAGHCVHIDDPDAANTAIRAFLTRVESR